MIAQEKNEEKKVLAISSFIEMGERYVFYTIQSLLVLYLIDQLYLPHDESAKLAGTVFGMVYISALLGGYIAERLLNYYTAILLGSVILIVGCFMMTSVHSKNTLFIGLALISISSGLIKSNVSALIGKFYDRVQSTESQRDFGFNIFYMGINTGILFATFFAVYLRDQFGFGPTFYISTGVALLIAFITTIGFFLLKKENSNNFPTLKNCFYSALLIAFYVGFVIYLLKHSGVADMAFIFAAMACAMIMIISAKKGQIRRVIASTIFFLLSILYWSLYMQLFISLLLFLHYCVQHHFIGIPINTSQFVSVESIFVIVMGVGIGKLWIYFENKNKPVHDIDKFNLSFLLIGIMFLIFYTAIALSADASKVSAIAIIVGVFFMAVSELALSAIGLSMVTKIAPKGYVSIYMGVWLVTIGLGSKLAGQMSSYIMVNKNIALSKIAMSHGLLWFMGLSVVGMMISFLTRKQAIVDK